MVHYKNEHNGCGHHLLMSFWHSTESSSEEESPVTWRRSQSSPPYSTIDQKLLVDVHVGCHLNS